MPVSKHTHSENRLLAALPRKDRLHFLEGCEQVELVFADVLGEAGAPIQHVYFPVGSSISLVVKIGGHPSLEVAVVGNEGMIGVPLLLGVDTSSLQFLVQGSGPAWRMSAAQFRRELAHSTALQQELSRYLCALTGQLAQTAACIRFHVVEARLAKWLLMTQDRAHTDEFHVTHEFLADMLGVRRVGITKAAGSLQKKKLIRYHRGDIRILNRKGLEAASCGCYRADREIYERLLG